MAIRPEDEYTNATPASASYPQGSFKNESVAGLLDGTPFEKAWPNDIFGFLQKVLDVASISPSGAPDTVLSSDYYNAMAAIFFNNKFRTVSISGPLLVTDKIVYADASAGDVVLSPPTAAAMVANGSTNKILIKRIDSSINKVQITNIQGDVVNLTGTGTPFVEIASDGSTIYFVGA
jgi:hypothetical protein